MKRGNSVLLKNCKLVEELTEGYDIHKAENADILVEDGIISNIAPAGTLKFEGKVIDVKGNTVMPGMFDLHMHLVFTTMNVPEIPQRSERQVMVDAMNYSFDYLRAGFTTVRDCGCQYHVASTLRDFYESGSIMGPRIIASAACNTPTTKGNDTFGNLYNEFNSPDEARAIVRDDLAHGADFIKYMATGAVMNIGGDPGAMICSYEELKALSDAAKENNTYVAAHCHGVKGIKACTEAEIGSIEHATFIDDECIEMLLKHNNVTALIPTFTVAYSMAKDLNGDTPDFMQEKTIECVEHLNKYIIKAYRAGIRMGWGTDSDKVTFNQFPGLEFKARSEAGFSNIELLKMATIDSAKIAELDEKVGTIKVGKEADLICVEGDPVQDIKVMCQLPQYVFKKGKLFIE